MATFIIRVHVDVDPDDDEKIDEYCSAVEHQLKGASFVTSAEVVDIED